MTPEEQLKVLAKIWTRKRRRGRVFLPWWEHDENGVRKGPMQQSKAYRWPQQESEILDHLRAHARDEVLFTPLQFRSAQRGNDQVIDEDQNILFADIDDKAGDPRDWKGTTEFRPTVCWETSPGSYQGVWMLQRGHEREGMCDPGQENQRLTYHIGADTGGWYPGKLLRVPGCPNRKADHVKNGKPFIGKLLWSGGDKGPVYQFVDLADLPPVSDREQAHSLIGPHLIASIPVREVRRRLRKNGLGNSTYRKLKDHDQKDKGDLDESGNDRSAVLWGMAKDLARAGADVPEIIALLRESGWNKHSGQHDELNRLLSLGEKARGELTEDEVKAIENNELQPDDTNEPSSMEFGSAFDWLDQRLPDVEWLVDRIWPAGSCGWVAAAPKSYKSWAVLDMAVAVATGQDWMGEFKVQQGPVMYLQEEDRIRTQHKRLKAVVHGNYQEYTRIGKLETDGSSVWSSRESDAPPIHIRVGDGFVISSEESLEWLEEMIEQHNLKLVVIDTLYSTLGAGVETKNGEQMMDRALKPIRSMSRATGCSIMIVHHNRKEQNNGGRAAASLAGSVAMHGWADAGLYFGERDSNKQVKIYVENKEGSSEEFFLDVSSLDRTDPRYQSRVHVATYLDSDTNQWVHAYDPPPPMSWAPYPVWQSAVDTSESDADGSTTHTGGDGTGPGSQIARQMANVGMKSESTSKSIYDIIKAIPTAGGNKQRKGALQRQLDKAVEKGLVEAVVREGMKNVRYFSTI